MFENMTYIKHSGEHNGGRGDDKGNGSVASELWARYHLTRDVADRNRLAVHYLPMVSYQARTIGSHLPKIFDEDDLIGAGQEGLFYAIESYDPSKGIKFESYGQWRIRGSILDWLRELDAMPRLVRERLKKYHKVRDAQRAEKGYFPEDMEVASEMGLDYNKLREAVEIDSNLGEILSLDAVVRNKRRSSKSSRFLDDVSSEGNASCYYNPEHRQTQRDLLDYLTGGLSRTEKLVIVLYYYEGLTMKEISKVIDLSESRVSQMRASVLERLRELPGLRVLAEESGFRLAEGSA